MSEPDNTIIAGSKTCGDWRAFRCGLVPGGDRDLWQRAFDEYFNARIRLRYLDPIDLLQRSDLRQGEGFSVVAIHCTLVEFLESTLRGITYRYVRQDAELGPYEYRRSGEVFVGFLCNREPFRQVFNENLARDFYENIRCAVLHEARTNGGWRIWADSQTGAILDAVRRILYRNDFHQAIITFIAWYRDAITSDSAIQEAFLRKFNSLCNCRQ